MRTKYRLWDPLITFELQIYVNIIIRPIFLSIVTPQNIQQKIKNFNIPRQARACSTTIYICLIFFLSSLQSTALRTFLSLHGFFYLYKINKNRNYTLLKTIFFICFLQKINGTGRTTIWKDRMVLDNI